MSYGWDAGVLGGIIETEAFQSAMKVNNPIPNTTTFSMIVASFLLASWLGCCFASTPWSDRLGRRTWIMLGAVVQIIGTIICVSAYSYGQMIAGRVVIGIGNGLVVSMGPVYVAEITPVTAVRGPLVGYLMGFACTGTALAYWIDFGFTYASGQVVWRLPLSIQIIWSLLVFVLIWPNGDTPRWYYLRGREQEGLGLLKQLYPTEEEALKVQNEIQVELRQESEPLKLSNLIVDKSATQAVRRIRDGVILVGVAYLMGINMIFYYMTTIFQVYIGLQATTASICSGAATTLLAIGVFFGSYFCERAGRRKWLLWGAALQSVFMIAFTILLSFGKKATSSAAAAMLFGWILVFSPTWAPMPYIYVSESMPLKHRHTGVGLSISSQWLMAFLTVYAGPIAVANVGWKTWIWFTVFNVIGFPYVYFFIYETQGRTLENVNYLFDKNHELEHASDSEIGKSSVGVDVEEKTAPSV
ncbi:general substrate transporter [Xylogone sp. PMI_703]|nr:general substrate transporter [Xylogone sp. PMI_703]